MRVLFVRDGEATKHVPLAANPQSTPHYVVVLGFEDEMKVASFIQRGLEAEHYHVDLASDGESGLSTIFDEDYDLVILDIMLPKRDGFSVLEEVRKRESLWFPISTRRRGHRLTYHRAPFVV